MMFRDIFWGWVVFVVTVLIGLKIWFLEDFEKLKYSED